MFYYLNPRGLISASAQEIGVNESGRLLKPLPLRNPMVHALVFASGALVMLHIVYNYVQEQ